MREYAPEPSCIDNNVLQAFNKRMGMQENTQDGKTCFSIDVGSAFSTYKYPNDTEPSTGYFSSVVPKPDIANVLLQQKSINDRNIAKLTALEKVVY